MSSQSKLPASLAAYCLVKVQRRRRAIERIRLSDTFDSTATAPTKPPPPLYSEVQKRPYEVLLKKNE